MTEPIEPTLPVGWYDSDDGRRYWDGTMWLAPTDAPAAPGAGTGDGLSRRALVRIVAASVFVAGIAIGGLALISQRAGARASAEEASSSAAAAADQRASASAAASRRAIAAAAAARAERQRIQDQLDAETAANAEQDAAMIASGPWQVVETGHVYFRFADDEEFTCGQWDCTVVVVVTKDGCPNGVYVEASVLQGETVVGLANGTIGALLAREVGTTMLEDISGSGDTFRVSKVKCR